MVQITIDVPDDVNKSLEHFKAEHRLSNKREAVVLILKEQAAVYGRAESAGNSEERAKNTANGIGEIHSKEHAAFWKELLKVKHPLSKAEAEAIGTVLKSTRKGGFRV
ncbi:TPA: DUF2683 family protein [Candidatus Woesearchaeota archaeon]|nr:DUF2683 family protein [Candidatus Woesearchaeota archaeon]HII69412.1 DUF2683 family protein [Candidatus Woesearchaeota archaeon]